MNDKGRVREPVIPIGKLSSIIVEVESPLCGGCKWTRDLSCGGKEFYFLKTRKFLCRKVKDQILSQFDESAFIKITPDELTPEMLALLEVLET